MRYDDEEDPLDIERELARLDEAGTIIDFDAEDKAESAGASYVAIGFFALSQCLGFVVIGKDVSFSFCVLSFITNVLYIQLIRSNPGRLPKGNVTSSLRSQMEDITARIRNPELKKKLFCRYCRIVRPPRAKHCHKCGCCIAKFDHHCFWLHNCVGAVNHRLFLVFLVFVTCWLFQADMYLLNVISPPRKASTTHDPTTQALALLLAGIGVAMLLFAVPLLIGHLCFASLNITTLEFMKPESAPYLQQVPINPFDKGIFRNWYRFCFVTAPLPQDDYTGVL